MREEGQQLLFGDCLEVLHAGRGGDARKSVLERTKKEIFNDYEGFVEKFKPKKTTDDCLTPPGVYEAVRDWVVEEYGLQGRPVVRPFWPEGDPRRPDGGYEAADYPAGCVVIDNPPFSITAKILRFFNARGINYFLFAHAKDVLGKAIDCNVVMTSEEIAYENGAMVLTGFATNLGKAKIRVSGRLSRLLHEANEKSGFLPKKKHFPKISWPPQMVKFGDLFSVAREYLDFDALPEEVQACRRNGVFNGRTVYGGYALLSPRAWRRLQEAIAEAKRRKEAKQVYRIEMKHSPETLEILERLAAAERGLCVEGMSEREREICAGLGTRPVPDEASSVLPGMEAAGGLG